MKKTTLALLFINFIVYNSLAQIKVWSGGKVSVGNTTISPSTSDQTLFWGPVNFIQSNSDQTLLRIDALNQPDWGNTIITNTINKGWTKNYVTSLNTKHTFCVYSNGEVWAKKYTKWSDSTLKTQINVIDSALYKILQLRGVAFKYKDEIAYADTSDYIARLRIGVIAQEVNTCYP